MKLLYNIFLKKVMSMEEASVYDFGLRIKQLRRSRKWTQKDVAERIKVTKETIYRYENNLLTPSLDSAIRLALLFNVSLDYLTGLKQLPLYSDPHHNELIHHATQEMQHLSEYQINLLIEVMKQMNKKVI